MQESKIETLVDSKEISLEEKEKGIDNYLNQVAEGTISLNYFTLLRKFPKAMKILEDYLFKLTEFTPTEDMMVATFLYNFRNIVYQVLDEEEIFISVGKKIKWEYTIILGSGEGESDASDYKNRSEAERACIFRAFEILESK